MNQLHTLWTEKKYQELSQRCQKLLSEQPDNGAVECMYAKSTALLCTLMQPTLEEATQTFIKGFGHLTETGVKAQALLEFVQTLEMTNDNLEALFVPVCKYEASVEELRKCKALLVSAAEAVLALYTPEMLADSAFQPSYQTYCTLGMQAAEDYCMTRGVEKITSKKTFISVNFVLPEDRASMVERYDKLTALLQKLKPDFTPSETLERNQPSLERIQETTEAFRHYLNPEEAAAKAAQAAASEEKPKKGGFFQRLFR